MKYLKTYESLSYTDIRNDIEDILSEIVDMGYRVRVLLTDFFHIVEINIYNRSHPEAFTQENLEEINQTIGRLYDYMRGHKEYGNVIQLQGDKRQDLRDILVKDYKINPECIELHGY